MQVSVIIPAYNAAAFLQETIESVLSQTFTDWELLVVDDGSTDQTPDIVQHYQKVDSRIQLIRQANQGVSATRNSGVANSQGDYIAFLDADDQWLPQKLSAHLAHLAAKPEVSSARLTHLQPELFLSENPTTTTSNWFIRRAVWDQVGGFCREMSYSEDLEWLLRVRCTTTWEIEGIDPILVRYRTSSGGLSADLYRMEAGWNTLVNQARTYAPQLIQQHFAQAQAIHLRYLARRTLRLTLPSHVGIDFINRSLRSYWQLPLLQPRRTLLTLAGVYIRSFKPFCNP
jgi:glycosyltransferase involved in cell wall biosynthesis